MNNRKYSRLISLIFFIEYGAYFAVLAGAILQPDSKAMYAGLNTVLIGCLIAHGVVCLLLSASASFYVARTGKSDFIGSALLAMLVATLTLPLSFIGGGLLIWLLTMLVSPLAHVAGGLFSLVVVIVGYVLATCLPPLLMGRIAVRRQQKGRVNYACCCSTKLNSNLSR